MPALLTVAAGASVGKQLWIEKQVLRIGSDPNADLHLASSELEAQVVMVEFDKGKYVVHNKSGRSLLLDSRPLAAGQNAPWPVERELDLGSGYRVVLQVEGNCAPAPRQTGQRLRAQDVAPAPAESADATGSTAPGAAPPGAEGGGSEIVQIAVILLCVVGCIAMIALPGKSDSASSKCPTFGEVHTALVEAKLESSLFWKELQNAQENYTRKLLPTALREFQHLLEESRKWEPSSEEEKKAQKVMESYLKCQILKLTST